MTTAPATDYHWFLYGQVPQPAGPPKTVQSGGIVNVRPGNTRQQVFQHMVDEIARKYGGTPVVMFWSLEPNDLTPAAQAEAQPALGGTR